MAVNSYKDDEKLTEKSKAVTLKRLFSYLLAYKWQILLVLVLMFYGVAISLLNPIMIESAIDRYIGNNNIPGLFRLMGIALILNLFVVLAMKIRMYIMAKVCNNILLTIRQQLYTHIQKLDFAFFDSRPTGKILSRIIGDINSLKDVLSNSVTTLIPDMITVIAVVGIMFTKNPKLAAASLISTPFMVFGMFFIEVHAHPKWQAFRKKSSNLNAFIHEDMSGMRIIKSFTAEDETKETFDVLTKEHRDGFLKAVRLSDAFGSVIDLSWGIGCISLYFVDRDPGAEHVTLGTFLAFGTYINMFWQPINNLSNFYNQLVTNIAGAERIFEILDTKPAIADGADVAEMPEIKEMYGLNMFHFLTMRTRKCLTTSALISDQGETIWSLVGAPAPGNRRS